MIAYLIALTSHSLSHYYSQVHLIIECFLAACVGLYEMFETEGMHVHVFCFCILPV